MARALSTICAAAMCESVGWVPLWEDAEILSANPRADGSEAVRNRESLVSAAVARHRAELAGPPFPSSVDGGPASMLFPVTAGEQLIAVLAFLGGEGSRDLKTALWEGVRDAVSNASMRLRDEAALRRRMREHRDAAEQWKETATEQERLHRSVFNGTPVMMHVADVQGRILTINEQWMSTLGYSEEEVVGTLSTGYLTEAFQSKAAAIRAGLMERGSVTGVDAQALTKSGKVIDVLVGAKLVSGPDGAPARIVTTLLDITERKRAEASLRFRESCLSAIFENQPGLVWLKDGESRFLAVNRKFAQACGEADPDRLVGKTDFDYWPEEISEKYRKDDFSAMQSGLPVRVEEPIYDQGEERWFETFKTPVRDARGEIIGTTGYAHDITARKQKEEALRNLQKLEALGILAGGIAHDFNNLLGGIFGYIDLSVTKTTEPPVSEMLSKALGTIDRARGLTRQLLTFSRGGSPVKTVEQLAPFIRETAKFALSGSPVSCRFELAPDLWLCEVDKNQIGQVIDNIVINAHQAMPNGGSIEISAQNVTVPTDEVPTLLEPGRYVRFRFSDSGVGIPKEIASRIFDPFFTTKSTGHGLGLATCHSIVHRHGGGIEVASEPGKGSVVTVFLPATAAPISSDTEPPAPAQGGGTVIVLDDETVIRDILKAMLSSLGYTVLATRDGTEVVDALTTMKREGESAIAVILDLTIPGGMGGGEAAKEIRRLDPKVPLFAASGYADDPIMAAPEAHGFRGSLTKPFRLIDLAEMFRRGLAT